MFSWRPWRLIFEESDEWFVFWLELAYNIGMNKERVKIQRVVADFKREVREIYGDRLVKVILFGSWARDTATEGSDIDLLVVLEGEVMPGREIDRMIDCITDINLRHDTLVAVIPISKYQYTNAINPFLINIRKEGIPA